MRIGDIVQVLYGNSRNPELKTGMIVGPPIKRPHTGYTFEVLIDGNIEIVMREHIAYVIKSQKH